MGRLITIGAVTYPDDLGFPINSPLTPGNVNVPGFEYIAGPIGFRDGLPDTVFLYDEYPDSNHPVTPEPTFPGATFAEQRAAAIEDAKNSIVKFLLALTDPRVKFEQAPFDRPQIFVPVDGTAPENTGGPAVLAADVRFRNIPAVGAGGNVTPLPAFLGVTSIPPGALGFSCSAASGAVSHFCSTITP
jgi:hypothetical protein